MTDVATNPRLDLLRRRLGERGLVSQPHGGDRPALSDGQRRMWFVHELDPTRVLLNVCLSYRVTGELDVERLHRAVDAVARRHPVLRTTYAADDAGEPRATVHDALAPAWAVHDASELSARARALRLEVLAQREFGRPFELSHEAPVRVTLIRTGSAEHLMLLVAHHIAWDDGSLSAFFGDLCRAYAGEDLPALTPAAELAPSTDAEDLDYWRRELTNPPEPLELPGANGSAVPTSFRSRRATATLSGTTVAAARDLARDSGASPYMVLLAAFGVLVHRYTHATDFLVAAPVSNRSNADVVGYHGNTVALRLRPTGRQSFRELVTAARDTALGAFAHQRVNLDRVVADLNPDRRYFVERMTRVSFGFREAGARFAADGVTLERADLRGHTTQLPFGLMVEFDATASGDSIVEAEFLTEVVDVPLGTQLLRHFVVLLDNLLAAPDEPVSRPALHSDDEARWLNRVATGESFETPATTLPALVADQAARTPDATAVVSGRRRVGYRELDEAANRLAHWLIERGVGTEDAVAVVLDKSIDLVVTALAIIKAGGVYLPVDPQYPEDRIAYLLADARPKVTLRAPVIGLDGYSSASPTDDDRIRPLHPDNAAYLVYTSGSTGLPKGVAVPHRPIAEYLVWFRGEYQVSDADRLLQVASPSFDVSIGELFGMLSAGARLVIPRPGGLAEVGYLTELIRAERITSMHFVPSLLGLFLSLPGVVEWRTLQRVPVGGEPLPGPMADKFHATFDALLHNFYGPTEAVLNCTRFKVEGKQGARNVPIGRPKINTTIHLLDDTLQPVPVGAIGEIYIAGSQLARGYHGQPGLTAERFVADPFTPGARMYRSGDLARRNVEGDVEFVGRADEQVKIRGFRIELGEVAAAIGVDPSVGQAVVVARDLPDLGASLVAYVTPVEGEDSADVPRIRARVAAALPDYMVPAAYVEMTELPITTHGKIDHSALPAPRMPLRQPFRGPATDTEHIVAGVFAELLGLDDVGVDESFFDLGGHSLLVTRLAAAVRLRCGVDVEVGEVFELGTAARIAARIDELGSGRIVDDEVIE